MAYKDKEKQKEAVRQAVRRHRKRMEGITHSNATVIPSVIPEQNIPGPRVIPAEEMLQRPQAFPPNVQAIWDGRNAQGQAAGYSEQATAEDYPQIQRPMR